MDGKAVWVGSAGGAVYVFEICEGDCARAFVRIWKGWSWDDLLSMFGLWSWMGVGHLETHLASSACSQVL